MTLPPRQGIGPSHLVRDDDYEETRSLGALLHALRALRPCDPRNDALDSDQTLVLVDLVLLIVVVVVLLLLLVILVVVVVV